MPTTEAQHEDNEEEEFPLTALIPIGIILTIFITIAVIGKIFTILAFYSDKQLKTVYNTYIVNLALADLLIGLFSMPFYSVYILKSYSWPFGDHFCKVFLVIDFTLCLETVLMMIVLSWDRTVLLAHGPMYEQMETFKMAYIKISVSWIIAFLLYGPAIIGWDTWTGKDVVEPSHCHVQFANHFIFTTVTAILEFACSFICLCVLNFYIYWKIRKRTRVHSKSKLLSTRRNPVFTEASRSIVKVQQGKTVDEIITKAANNGDVDADKNIAGSSKPRQEVSGTIKANTVRRDTKAAKSLVLLVIVFLITWAPYTITTIIISFCEEYVNKHLYEALYCLLWFKASVNPFLYAFNSNRFKDNFRSFLCSSRRNVQTDNTATFNEDVNITKT